MNIINFKNFENNLIFAISDNPGFQMIEVQISEGLLYLHQYLTIAHTL